MVHTFWPLITHSSPSSTAEVFRLARSDPEFGSLKPWHQRISPRRIFGRKSCFCSSVPHCRIVGPTSVSPKKSARIGALARANSSARTTPSMVDRPLPPYSLGQVAQIHPPPYSFFGHSALNAARSSSDSSGVRPASTASYQPAGRLSSSHPRTSLRNGSVSAGYVRSICQS